MSAEPVRSARRRDPPAVLFALFATSAAVVVALGSYAEWPPIPLLAMLFSGGLTAVVAVHEARAMGRRRLWVPIGVSGVAMAAATALASARLLSGFP